MPKFWCKFYAVMTVSRSYYLIWFDVFKSVAASIVNKSKQTQSIFNYIFNSFCSARSVCLLRFFNLRVWALARHSIPTSLALPKLKILQILQYMFKPAVINCYPNCNKTFKSWIDNRVNNEIACAHLWSDLGCLFTK